MGDFTFIDLFAGIGGFRVGLEAIGGECVFSAEINDHACKMYELNFGDNPKCDITTLDEKSIPNHDILCAGFPCQPFSISGKQLGFEDTRGTLFFDIARIINEKKPKVVFLENVKNLAIHDKGNTLKVILKTLKNLGYNVEYKVLNAKDFGVPQNRERIIIIGSRDGINFDFDKVKLNKSKPMKDFLEKKGIFEYLDSKEYTIIDKKYIKTQEKSGLKFVGYRNKNLRKVGVKENTEHLSRVHKQVNRIYSSDGMHPTISSQEKNGRYFIYHKEKVRKITINECFKFFGFPDNFKKIGKDSLLYERIGNSVCVPMIKVIGEEIKKQILEK